MAAGASRINMCILFTNHKSPSIHSESAPRRSKARTYSYGGQTVCYGLVMMNGMDCLAPFITEMPEMSFAKA